MIPDARTDREYEAYAKEQRAALAPDRPVVAEQQGGGFELSPSGGLQRGDQVMVAGEWYPVDGYALRIEPGGAKSGSVFTLKPHGRFEPCLGYRIAYQDITAHRRPTAAP